MARGRPKAKTITGLADAQTRTRAECEAWYEKRYGALDKDEHPARISLSQAATEALRGSRGRSAAVVHALRTVRRAVEGIAAVPDADRMFIERDFVERSALLLDLDGVIAQAGVPRFSLLDLFVLHVDYAHPVPGGGHKFLTNTELAKLAITWGYWTSRWRSRKVGEIVSEVAAEIAQARVRQGTLKTLDRQAAFGVGPQRGPRTK